MVVAMSSSPCWMVAEPWNLKATPLSLKFRCSTSLQPQPQPQPQCSTSVKHNDDLQALLQILPFDLHHNLLNQPNRPHLLEVILDLGRFPEARYLGKHGTQYLRNTEVTVKELEYAQQAVGEFGEDNRAGIEGTLHRISAIRSRNGGVVGLTCRIGRAVSGQIDMVYDLLQYGKSILFVGRPGVGKTTVLREIARVLSDEFHKRVVIVDSSNEIGGDGNIPHAAIGGARRMQVPEPSLQHSVMIEAVENHMPEVIIVDEIGTKAEANACRSIAERGIMLVGTAHGHEIENVMKNPTLSDLIGGIDSVTLGDTEARARNCQKTILERKAPPTFDFLIEMRDRHYWLTHQTDKSVDMLLRGKSPQVEDLKMAELRNNSKTVSSHLNEMDSWMTDNKAELNNINSQLNNMAGIINLNMELIKEEISKSSLDTYLASAIVGTLVYDCYGYVKEKLLGDPETLKLLKKQDEVMGNMIKQQDQFMGDLACDVKKINNDLKEVSTDVKGLYPVLGFSKRVVDYMGHTVPYPPKRLDMGRTVPYSSSLAERFGL